MNEYLNQFKGDTINDRIVKDSTNYLLEEKLKITEKNPNEVSLVTVTNSKTKEITSIGGSIPNDLITDALGLILAEHHRFGIGAPPITDFSGMIADDGVSRSFRFVNNLAQDFYNFAGERGGQVKIGQSSTPVTRSNFDIGSPFIVPPESLPVNVSPPVYNSALGQMTYFTLQVAGGSGTIKEIGMFILWRDITTGSTRLYMVAHDLISPSVSFSVGQSIATNWTWQF